MRKAKDERIRIAAAFFRNSFDEEDDEEKMDKVSLSKESEKTFSQTTSDDDSIRTRGKSSVATVKIPSKLIAPDLELAASTLYIQDHTFKRLQSSKTYNSSNNVDEQVISGHNAGKKNNEDSDVISKVKTRKLAMPRTNYNSIFPASKHEDVARESSVRFQALSVEDYSTRANTKPTIADRSKPDFLEVPSGSSEHFRFSVLSERSTSVKECSDVGKVRDIVQQPLTATIRDSFDEKSCTSGRRSTLPMTSSDLSQSTLQNPTTEADQKSPTLKNILAGTSVNPIRKSSIANAAICSSLAPSLLGAIPGVPNSLLPNGDYNLQRSATLSNLSTTSTAISDDISIGRTRRSLKSFLRLHIPEPHPTIWHDIDEGYHHHLHNHHHHHHHVFSHIPTITFTAPATDGIGRKFNFAIRRHSQAVSVKPRCTSFRNFNISFLLTSVENLVTNHFFNQVKHFRIEKAR